MNDFTKNITQALFNQDKINDLLRHEIQQVDKSKVVNKLIMKYIIDKGYMIIKYRYCYDKF